MTNTLAKLGFVACCLLFAGMMADDCSAQSRDMSQSILGYSNDMVSVHELSITNDARDSYNKGVRCLKARDWTGSASNFRRAIKLAPEFYEAYDLLGAAELGMQNWDGAEASFRKSIELSAGEFASPHFGLGLVLSHRREFADAEAMIRDGLRVSPANPGGDFCLGWVLYLTGRLSEAEQSTQEAIVHKPSFPEPYLLLAQIHLFQRDPAAEIKDLDGYLTLEPNGPRSARARAARDEAERALPSGENNNVP
jgi:tetratricopeptide (TPR) repeat protein